jgi:hypothetical protein
MLNGNTNIFTSNVRRFVGKAELNGDAFLHNENLVSFTLTRLGDTRFFGYGVSATSKVKVLDKDRVAEYAVGDSVNLYLDEVKFAPTLYVSGTQRNENNNELTITAVDKIDEASKHTMAAIQLSSYTIGELAEAIANYLGLGISLDSNAIEFDLSYETGANFDGSETLREALDDIAEATGTIYYISANDDLTFIRLNTNEPTWHIDRSNYFNLKTQPSLTLEALAATTELGDNVVAGEGVSEVLKDNAFLDLREDVADILEGLLSEVSNPLTMTPFEVSWRGNYLLEPGEFIAVEVDGGFLPAYFINDTLTYTGGLSQKTSWSLKAKETGHKNPTTLGEAIKETYARVDKANKRVDIVVSESQGYNSRISTLELNLDSIEASVSNTEERLDDVNGDVSTLTEKVNAAITPDDLTIEVQKQIENGVNKVETTTGFTFNEEGLTVSKTGSEITTTITEDGMKVSKSGDEVLRADNEGVKAIDLHAETFLIIGRNSRLEDYGSRTGCFWIGGNY